jgi:hypothetical protein
VGELKLALQLLVRVATRFVYVELELDPLYGIARVNVGELKLALQLLVRVATRFVYVELELDPL